MKSELFLAGLWRLRSLRLHVALLLCLGMTAFGVMKSNLSMAVVCMLNDTATTNLTNPNDDAACAHRPRAQLHYQGSFHWSANQQAFIHSAFFWGGFASGFPSGYLTDRYGSKVRLLSTE